MDSYEERTITDHRVVVDRDLCVGTQACVHVAPDVFILGYDQIVTFVSEPADIDVDRLVEACAVCPVGALLLYTPNGERIVP